MREVVTIQVGQAGNRIGQAFWDILTKEHGLTNNGCFKGVSDLQLENIDVFFERAISDKFVPRAVMTDLESGTVEHIKSGHYGRLFNPEYCVYGAYGSGNNYAKGYYSDGPSLLERIEETIRRVAEKSENMQAFQVISAAAGGAGSGLSSLILEFLKDNYPEVLIATFTIFPSRKLSDVVLEPYNTALCMKDLIEIPDETFVFDNEALYKICNEKMKLPTFSMVDMNYLIALFMCGLTAGFRFPGQINTSFRKITTNLLPNPNLHFLVTAIAPLVSRALQPYESLTVQDIVLQMFDPRSIMLRADVREGKYLTCAGLFRGRMSSKEVMEKIYDIQESNKQLFLGEWVGNCSKVSICDIPQLGFCISGVLAANNTVVTYLFDRIVKEYTTMFRKRAFLHWYVSEGMDENEFVEAGISIKDLISEYEAAASLEENAE